MRALSKAKTLLLVMLIGWPLISPCRSSAELVVAYGWYVCEAPNVPWHVWLNLQGHKKPYLYTISGVISYLEGGGQYAYPGVAGTANWKSDVLRARKDLNCYNYNPDCEWFGDAIRINGQLPNKGKSTRFPIKVLKTPKYPYTTHLICKWRRHLGDPTVEPTPPPPVVPTPTPALNPFWIYLLTNASNGLYIGREGSLDGRNSCTFEGGGNCPPYTPITFVELWGPFETAKLAEQALCQHASKRSYWPAGIGWMLYFPEFSASYGQWDASVYGLCDNLPSS